MVRKPLRPRRMPISRLSPVPTPATKVKSHAKSVPATVTAVTVALVATALRAMSQHQLKSTVSLPHKRQM